MKRILSAVLIAAMLLSVSTAALAEGSNEVITASVRYYSGHDDLTHDFETTFKYSDNCFSKSAFIYRQDLAEASLGMTFAAFSSKDAAVQVNEDQNWISTMTQCGFSDTVSNEWYRTVPEHDSIGVCCARKSISTDGGECTLIAVGIRGNFYRREWGGNMNVGASGDHQGWCLCRDQVLEFVKSYIAEYGISGRVKLWISGYSRAAAAANMVTAALDDGYILSENIELTPENIYCYCFETPTPTMNGDARAERYWNIQNFINENDVVTYLPFANWGFTRYGVDRVVPTDGDADYQALLSVMLEDFNAIPNNGGGYMVDDFKFIRYDPETLMFTEDYSVSQKEYYAMLSEAMVNDFAFSREDYVENLQFYLIEVLGIIFNRNNLDFNGALNNFLIQVQNNYELIIRLAGSIHADKYYSMYMLLEGMLFESLNAAGITEFTAPELYDAVKILLARLINMTINNPEVMATLIANAKTIISAHYAELCMAWVRTLPPDYMTGGIEPENTVTIEEPNEEPPITEEPAEEEPVIQQPAAEEPEIVEPAEEEKPSAEEPVPTPAPMQESKAEEKAGAAFSKAISSIKTAVNTIFRLFKKLR